VIVPPPVFLKLPPVPVPSGVDDVSAIRVTALALVLLVVMFPSRVRSLVCVWILIRPDAEMSLMLSAFESVSETLLPLVTWTKPKLLAEFARETFLVGSALSVRSPAVVLTAPVAVIAPALAVSVVVPLVVRVPA